jgi:hypothetical protein
MLGYILSIYEWVSGSVRFLYVKNGFYVHWYKNSILYPLGSQYWWLTEYRTDCMCSLIKWTTHANNAGNFSQMN